MMTIKVVVVLVIGLLTSCQVCLGEPTGHVTGAKTSATALDQQQDATVDIQSSSSGLLLPTPEALVESRPNPDDMDQPRVELSPPPLTTDEFQSGEGNNYNFGKLGRPFGQMSLFPKVIPGTAQSAFEDTTQAQRIYVTLPESQPMHVPFSLPHRFGPVLRNPQHNSQGAKKFDENIILVEDNHGPTNSPYDTILKPLFISPDLIQIPMEDSKNEQLVAPANNPDNPSGSLLDLQKLFQYTKGLVNDNDVLVINDAASNPGAASVAEANVRNFTVFEGENEIDQMAVESLEANRNMTMNLNETEADREYSQRYGRSDSVDSSTGNHGESIDDPEQDREGAESKIRYSRFRKIPPIVAKEEDEDCDDEADHQNLPPAQQLNRDYLPSKEVNVEIIDDHNNGQFHKETVFVAAKPNQELEAPSRQFLKTFTGHTLSPDSHTTPLPPPIPIGLRLTPPKPDEDCDDPPGYKGKTIVEVQKSVSVTTERRVSHNPPNRGPPRFVTSKCLNDCQSPAPSPAPLAPTPIYLPAPPQQVIVEKPVVIDRVVEKPVQVTVEKIINRPYPVDRIVEKPVTVYKSVPVPVDRVVEKQVTKYVDRPVPYEVQKIVEKIIPQPYPVEKQVQVTVEKIVDRPVEVQVPVTQFVERIVDRPVEVERVVEKEVPVPYPVEVNKYIDRPYPVEKIVERPVHIPVPVETIVEKIVDRPVETIVETPVAVEVPVAVPHHIHHFHHPQHFNPHPHEHLLHQYPHHSHVHGHNLVKHVHLDAVTPTHFDYAKTIEAHATTILKPVHKLLGNLWSKLQSPFFRHHHLGNGLGHQTTKHVTLPLYKTKYHANDNHLYAGSYGYAADSLPGGSLYNGVALKDTSYYGPVPLNGGGSGKYDPFWTYGRTNYVAPVSVPVIPVANTVHLQPNRYNYRRHMNFLKNIRWEYGGFKPPLIPSVEIDEYGNPIHRELDSRRR